MKGIRITAFCLLALMVGGCSPREPTAPPATEREKTLYALGLHIANLIADFHLTEDELPMVKRGLSDGALAAEPVVTREKYGKQLDELLTERRAAAAAEERRRSERFMELIAQQEGIVKGEQGWLRQTLEEGTGDEVGPEDIVNVVFEGKLRTGKFVEKTMGGPDALTTVNLDTTVLCWTYGLPGVRVGGKYKLFCPPDLVHGDVGKPPYVPGGAAVIYEIEVRGITAL